MCSIAGQNLSRIAHDVDNACMTTSQSPRAEPFVLPWMMAHLIIMDEGIRFQSCYVWHNGFGILRLEAHGAGNFTGDEDHALYEHGGTYLFDDLDMFALQVCFVGGGKGYLLSIGQHKLSFQVRIRMQSKGHVAASRRWTTPARPIAWSACP